MSESKLESQLSDQEIIAQLKAEISVQDDIINKQWTNYIDIDREVKLIKDMLNKVIENQKNLDKKTTAEQLVNSIVLIRKHKLFQVLKYFHDADEE